MRILIINPNTTASMTRAIEENAKSFASSGVTVTALNPAFGPAAIQGPEDGEAALPGLFDLFDKEVIEKKAHDIAIIACFDDTGLFELKKRSPIPVIGVGEASFILSMMLGESFSVVTTLSVSIPVIEDNITKYGFKTRCAKVRASEVPVLAIENDEQASVEKIANEINLALKEDGCSSVILGCAGMTRIIDQLSARIDAPIIDSVHAAVRLAESVLFYQHQTPK